MCPDAFDPLAASYDQEFTHTIIGRYLRQQVQQCLLTRLPPGGHVLELGCGTGEDALFLAEHGLQITATDASGRMLSITHEKVQHNPRVTVARLDLAHLPADDFLQEYDGVFASFGPLNCLEEWKTLSRWLAARIRPGGLAAFGMMAPYCLWEMVWHGLHLRPKRALRRLRGSSSFLPEGGETAITIHYPSVAHLTKSFASHFVRRAVRPLGLFLPPTDVYPVVEKRPRLLRALLALEKRVGHVPQFALLADHYWIEFVRRG